MDEPKSVTSHACHVRVNHAQHRGGGDSGVNGRSASAKHIRTCGRGQAVGGGDHATRAEGGRAASLHIQNKLLKGLG